MHRYSIILISIFIAFITFTGASGDEQGAPGDDNTESILLRIKEASSEIATLQGDFVQKKKVEILKDMPDSTGRFYYKKPDSLRWEILDPVVMGFVVNGNQGKKWRGTNGKLRKFDVSREPVIGVISNQVFAWAKGDFDYLKAGYEIILMKEEPVEVKLLPVSSTEKKYIDSIILTFSETLNYVKDIEIKETRGGSTHITFTNMVINAGLTEDIF